MVTNRPAVKVMETILKRTLIRPHAFIWTLTVALVLSSMMGTAVWATARKSGIPGKPAPEPAIADYRIWIGIGEPNDVALQPYGEPETAYLLVEGMAYSGRWLLPPTKGKYNVEGWRVSLASVDPDGAPGEYCGTYRINEAEVAGVLGAHGVDSDVEAYRFSMSHSMQNHPQRGATDYWHLAIAWPVDALPIPLDPPIPHLHVLQGDTSREGVYDAVADIWTVTFESAEFTLHENTESGDAIELWRGPLSFTVTIERTLVEP